MGEPYKKRDSRGRKPKFSPIEYTAYTVLQKIFCHRYREMELESTLYLPDKADHSTFQRNYEKVEEGYFERLVANLVDRQFIYWIADSTAISTKIRVERNHQGLRCKAALTNKYHVLCGYDPPTHTVMIIEAMATDNHVSDSKAAITMIKGKKSNAYLLGDSAYNTYELHDSAKNAGLFPQMKPDHKHIRKTLSAKAKNVKLFSKTLYKNIRGVVETVFGGATNAGLIITYAKKEHNRRLDTLVLAIRHNLMAAMRKIYYVFVRQTPKNLCYPKTISLR